MPKGTPTYLTQNPDGTVSADFSGHVFALGLDLTAGQGSGSVTSSRKVVWHKDTKTGGTVAEIEAYYPVDASTGQINIRGRATSTQSKAEISLLGADSNQEIDVSVSNANGTVFLQKMLLNGLEQSSFLQLAGAALKRKISFGIQTATWTSSNFSAPVVFGHSLGVNPVFAIAGAIGAAEANYTVGGYDASNLSVTGCWITGIVTTAQNFFWMAIG